MKRLTSIALAIAAIGTAAVAAPPGPQVRIDTGTLAGAREGDVQVFRGIPYAAPPVGPLRWKATRPAAAWRGVRDATRFGAACPQSLDHESEFWAHVGPQSEDCLFLNVWRPAKAGRYPVMVFIHGGMSSWGAAR